MIQWFWSPVPVFAIGIPSIKTGTHKFLFAVEIGKEVLWIHRKPVSSEFQKIILKNVPTSVMNITQNSFSSSTCGIGNLSLMTSRAVYRPVSVISDSQQSQNADRLNWHKTLPATATDWLIFFHNLATNVKKKRNAIWHSIELSIAVHIYLTSEILLETHKFPQPL